MPTSQVPCRSMQEVVYGYRCRMSPAFTGQRRREVVDLLSEVADAHLRISVFRKPDEDPTETAPNRVKARMDPRCSIRRAVLSIKWSTWYTFPNEGALTIGSQYSEGWHVDGKKHKADFERWLLPYELITVCCPSIHDARFRGTPSRSHSFVEPRQGSSSLSQTC